MTLNHDKEAFPGHVERCTGSGSLCPLKGTQHNLRAMLFFCHLGNKRWLPCWLEQRCWGWWFISGSENVEEVGHAHTCVYDVCVCLYMWGMRVWGGLWMHAYESKRATFNVRPHLPPCIKQALFEVSYHISKASCPMRHQEAPPSVFLWVTWYFWPEPPGPVLQGTWGITLGSSCTHGKHFTQGTISPVLELLKVFKPISIR